MRNLRCAFLIFFLASSHDVNFVTRYNYSVLEIMPIFFMLLLYIVVDLDLLTIFFVVALCCCYRVVAHIFMLLLYVVGLELMSTFL